jgi:hypothetical protein
VVPVLRFVPCTLLAALGLALLDAVVLVSIASTPMATAEAPEVTPPAQEYCNAHYGQPRGDVFVWKGFTFQKYVGDAGCESHRQGIYLGTDVAVNPEGDLVISARRHCVTDALTEDSAVTESPCASRPRYSVGRVRLASKVLPSSDFEWGFDLRLPGRSAPGTRSAAWLINLDQIHCDPLWGEVDVMEWYSSRPDLPEAATHATCSDTSFVSWHHRPDAWGWGRAGRADFHRWAVRKQTVDGMVVISYLYDDRVYASHTCEERLSSPTCRAVFDRSWTAILQTAVFADGSGPFAGPEADKPFPTQELVVRAMWVHPI